MTAPVYENTVDGGRFKLLVVDTGDHQGQLTVTVVETGETLVDEEIGLAYGAIFGPDVDDVSAWQLRAISAIDTWLQAHGEEVPKDD